MERERWVLLHNLIRSLEPIMAVLGIIWTLLLVIDFTRGLSRPLSLVSRAIYAVFVIDFLIELIVAPQKWRYLKRHWLVAISLGLPVLRVARDRKRTRLNSSHVSESRMPSS